MIGLAFRSSIEQSFDSLPAVGITLTMTGIILAMTAFARAGEKEPLTTAGAIVISTVQGIAIIPGLSRSGTTISAGLFLGVDRVKAAEYSFLLAVPAILGTA